MLHSSGRICRHVFGRRCYSRSLQARAADSPASSSSGRKNLVFLGTPEVRHSNMHGHAYNLYILMFTVLLTRQPMAPRWQLSCWTRC